MSFEIEHLKKGILEFRTTLEKQMDIFKEHKDIRREYEVRLETIDQILNMVDIWADNSTMITEK